MASLTHDDAQQLPIAPLNRCPLSGSSNSLTSPTAVVSLQTTSFSVNEGNISLLERPHPQSGPTGGSLHPATASQPRLSHGDMSLSALTCIGRPSRISDITASDIEGSESSLPSVSTWYQRQSHMTPDPWQSSCSISPSSTSSRECCRISPSWESHLRRYAPMMVYLHFV
jgi:hypothetical protein